MSDSAGGGPANGRQVTGPAWYAPKRWIYRSGRPGRAAKAMNAFTAALYPKDKHVLRFEWPILILVAEEEELLAKYCFVSVASEP